MPRLQKQVAGLATLLALSLLALGFLAQRRHLAEPRHQGRSLSGWLKHVESGLWINHPDRSSQSWLEASNAIVEIGTTAMPWYIEWIRYEPSPTAGLVWRTVARARERVPRSLLPDAWAPSRGSGVDPWRWRAFASLEAMQILGPRLTPFIPELATIAATGQKHAASFAAQALSTAGPDAWPTILSLVTNTHLPGSEAAMEGLVSMGPQARPAIPTLIQRVESGNARQARRAVWILGALHLEPQESVPALRRILVQQQWDLQRVAAYALAEFGSNAAPALPDLRRLQEGSDRSLASAASNAVRAISR
ncbi:MAG: HEAT repeat domain-containing protein [Verrucomicrobia bacterium]|nr:HEAT repeat domain-containing protein [Verrucomicrobiota bacterium]